jgi:hypothetical protein
VFVCPVVMDRRIEPRSPWWRRGTSTAGNTRVLLSSEPFAVRRTSLAKMTMALVVRWQRDRPRGRCYHHVGFQRDGSRWQDVVLGSVDRTHTAQRNRPRHLVAVTTMLMHAWKRPGQICITCGRSVPETSSLALLPHRKLTQDGHGSCRPARWSDAAGPDVDHPL